MLVLHTLQWGPRHGHGIGQAIRTQSDDLLKVETGSKTQLVREQDRWSRLVHAIGRIVNPAPADTGQ